MHRRTVLTALVAFLGYRLAAQVTPPTASQLIARAAAVSKAQDERGWKYTYREDHSSAQLDKTGKAGPPVTRTYDHIMLEGSEYKKLVLIDGKPLDAKTQKKVDEDLEKTRAERRKPHLLSVNRTVEMSGLDQLEKYFDNTVSGEETVLGRQAWRMESEPKPGYKIANEKDREYLAARHTSWFDEQEGWRIKWRDAFVRQANGFEPGSVVDWELARVGDAWLFDNISFRVDMKIVLGIHARGESHQRFYDYKKFTVDSTMTPQ
jgi:hypothetical protein